MARRKSKHNKPKWEVIRTEDELRAEAAAQEARIRERSEAATEALVESVRLRTPFNPVTYGNRLLQPLWLCAVSLYGLLYAGWSPAAVVVCFWFDKLARIVLVAARIYIHQVSTRKRGHFRRQMGFLPRRSGDGRPGFERRAVGGGTRLSVTAWGSAGGRAEAGPGTLFGNFVWMCAIAEVFGLLVMLWALKGMDEWTASTGVWGFIAEQWRSKALIIVLPLVLQFVIETITTLRRQSFAEIRTMAVNTYSAASIILPVFWIALLLAQYFDLAVLEPLVYTLIIAKTLYEVSLVVFGRDWEGGSDARLDNRLWGDDPAFARYAKQEAERRLRDEESLR